MGKLSDANVQNAMRHLQEVAPFVRVLGSFPMDTELGAHQQHVLCYINCRPQVPQAQQCTCTSQALFLVIHCNCASACSVF